MSENETNGVVEASDDINLEKGQKENKGNFFLDWVVPIAAAVVIALLIKQFLVFKVFDIFCRVSLLTRCPFILSENFLMLSRLLFLFRFNPFNFFDNFIFPSTFSGSNQNLCCRFL